MSQTHIQPPTGTFEESSSYKVACIWCLWYGACVLIGFDILVPLSFLQTVGRLSKGRCRFSKEWIQ